MKKSKIIFSFLFLITFFLIFPFLKSEATPTTLVAITNPILIAGGINSRVEKIFREEEKKKIEEEIKKRPPEYEVVMTYPTLLPKEVVGGYPLSPIVTITVGLKDKKTGELVQMPVGTKIIFTLCHTINGGINWEKGGEEFIFSVLYKTETWAINGPQITFENSNISENNADYYCFNIEIKFPE